MENWFVWALVNDYDGRIRVTARADDAEAVEALREKAAAPDCNGHLVPLTIEEYQNHP